MLDGWTPILLVGIVFAIVIYFISRKVSRKRLLLISNILSLISISIFIYSIVGIGGWEGLAVGIVAISTFVGIWLGALLGILNKKSANVN